ncbi:MAG TPA: hypothetical protein VHL79_15305 [Ramlibacter sp.]|jgi:sugar lactone lactonase YvrE|nr:hypothetical protein [Ramlibacter sp.]
MRLLAGIGSGPGHQDGPAAEARVVRPADIAFDAAGNLYFIGNGTLRRVSPDRVVTTVAGVPGVEGHVDGTGSTARLKGRWITTDAAGNVYLAGENVVRRITPQGVVTTVAGMPGAPLAMVDGPRATARFVQLTSIAADAEGNLLVVDNTRIRRVSQAGEVVTLTEPNSGAPEVVYGLVRAPDGSFYVSDGSRIFRYSVAGGFTLLAGSQTSGSQDGIGAAAAFSIILDLAVGPAGDVFVLESFGLRKVTPQGVVTTIRNERISSFGNQDGIAVDAAGNVYVSRVELITRHSPDGQATAWAGSLPRTGSQDGPAATASFTGIIGLAADLQGNVYVSEALLDRLRKIGANGEVTTIAQLPHRAEPPPGGLPSTGRIAIDTAGTLYAAQPGFRVVRKVRPDGTVTVLPGMQAPISETGGSPNGIPGANAWGVAVDTQGNVFVPDLSRSMIWKVTPAGDASVFAGKPGESGTADGDRATARLERISDITIDAAGNLFVTEIRGTIRKISPAGDVVTIATLSAGAITADAAGNLYVAIGTTIDRRSASGEWTTVVGTRESGASAALPSLPGPIGAMAVVPNPPNTVGTQLAVAFATGAVMLVTLPQ